jgi:hypothetical protein
MSMERAIVVSQLGWFSIGPQFDSVRQFESCVTSVIVPPPITGKLASKRVS